MFAVGLVLIAGLLFALVKETRPTRQGDGAAAPVGDAIFVEIAGSDSFRAWIKEWRKLDPYVSPAEFTLREAAAIVIDRPAYEPRPEALRPPASDRYVWSPDGSRFVDLLSSYGEPDSALTVYDRLGDGTVETLAFCGTPCGFDDAFWLDGDRVVVFGNEESLRDDGRPLCITSGDDVRRCYRKLVVTMYDFAADEKRTYVSGDHQFGGNPFGARLRDRWVRGLSAEEREALGVAATGESVVLRGEVVEYSPEARVLAIGGDAPLRFTALSLTAIVRDERGDLVRHDALRKGQEVEVSAVVGDDGALVALGVRIVRDPAIHVAGPRNGATVGVAFVVHGEARTFEGNVRIRLTNARTGRVLRDSFTTAEVADARAHAPFTFAASLPENRLRAGDPVTLEVFQESAEDGAEIDKVTLKLTYQP